MSNIDFRNTYVKREDGTMELISSVEIPVAQSVDTEVGASEQVAASIAQREAGLDYPGQNG